MNRWLVGVLVCCLSACPSGEVELRIENLAGYWYGKHAAGPLLLHFESSMPSVPAGSNAFESIGWDRLLNKGRLVIGERRVTLESVLADGSFADALECSVKLTAATLELRCDEELLALTRGESCSASGAWLDGELRPSTVRFGPDGRWHGLRSDGTYVWEREGFCYPMEEPTVRGAAITVGSDSMVWVIDPGGDGYQVAAFPAGAPHSAVRYSIGNGLVTSPLQRLLAFQVGTSPALLGRTSVWWWFSGGVWSERQFGGAGFGALDVRETPNHVVVREFGADAGSRVSADAVSRVAVPAHPALGWPSVWRVDAAGRNWGAWRVPTHRFPAAWDALAVGRAEGDGGWTMAWAGYGFPVDLRINDDGSADVVSVLARGGKAVAWTHVPATFEAGAWRTEYVGDSLPIDGGAADAYVALSADQSAVPRTLAWGRLPPQGAVMMGVGSVSDASVGFMSLRRPGEEAQSRPTNATLRLQLSGAPATVRFPSLGVSCSASCEVPVVARSLVPFVIDGDVAPQVDAVSPSGGSLSWVSQSPDGTWAIAVEPDGLQRAPFSVELRVRTVERTVSALNRIAPGVATRLAAHYGGDGSAYVLIGNDAARTLYRIGADGRVVASFAGLSSDTSVLPWSGGVALLSSVNGAPSVLWLDGALLEQGRAAALSTGVPVSIDSSGAVHVARSDGMVTTHSLNGLRTEQRVGSVTQLVSVADARIAVSAVLSIAEEIDGVQVPAGARCVRRIGGGFTPLAVPESVKIVATAVGSSLLLDMGQTEQVSWPSGSPLSDLEQANGSPIRHFVWLDATGQVLQRMSRRGLEGPDVFPALGLGRRGVIIASMNRLATALLFIGADGGSRSLLATSADARQCPLEMPDCRYFGGRFALLSEREVIFAFNHSTQPFSVEGLILDPISPLTTGTGRWAP